MSKKRRFLSPILLGAGFGLIVGVILILHGDFERIQPVNCAIISPQSNQSEKQEHTLDVRILSFWHYQKTSQSIEPLRKEMMIVSITPYVIVLVIFSIFGSIAFRQLELLYRIPASKHKSREMQS